VLWLNKFVECFKCGVVSGVEKALGGHFKTLHSTFVTCTVCYKVCIFLIFFFVPVFNIVLTWAGQLEYMDFLFFLVYYLLNEYNLLVLPFHVFY
jgi:hypothetical protein